jgi:hypothetical protein
MSAAMMRFWSTQALARGIGMMLGLIRKRRRKEGKGVREGKKPDGTR